MTDNEELLKCVGNEIEKIYDVLEGVKIVMPVGCDDLLFLLFIKILEGVESVIVLEIMEHRVGALIICRSIFETYVDFMNYNKNSKYIETMLWDFYNQEVKFLNHIDKNISLSDDERRVAGKRRKNAEKIKKSRLSNESRMFISKKFDLIGAGWMYETVYNYLCRLSHGNLDALLEGYSSNDILFSKKKENETHCCVLLVLEMLEQALVRIALHYRITTKCLSCRVRGLRAVREACLSRMITTPPAPARPVRPC